MTNVVLRLVHNRGAIEATKRYRTTTATNTTTTTSTEFEWEGAQRCRHRSNHGSAIEFDYPHRDPTKSFLFSLVRDPTKRSISKFFYYKVAIQKREPTDVNFERYAIQQFPNPLVSDLTFDLALGDKMKAELARFMTLWNIQQQESGNESAMDRRFEPKNHKWENVTDTTTTELVSINYTEVVGTILDNYDFIAVMERMDESLVALKLLLGLRWKKSSTPKLPRGGLLFQRTTRQALRVPHPFLSLQRHERLFLQPPSQRTVD